jgi:DNA polymerase
MTNPLAVIRDLRLRLEADRSFGITRPLHVRLPVEAPSAKANALQSETANSAMASSVPAVSASPVPRAVPAPASADERARRQAVLDGYAEEVSGCQECPLCESRTQTVYGVGAPCARLMFIGEGPGFDEDRLGEPFVGKAGHLLDRMIAAMGLSRAEVYIGNIVKCRPPNNRTPNPRETLSCLPYLFRQIETVAPEVIVTLGNTPTKTLLETEAGITRMRGNWQAFRQIPVLPTFHPAYLLRNPADKRLVWQDLQDVMGRLGLGTAN